MNFVWKKTVGRFINGSSLYVNRLKVAGYGWNGISNIPTWTGVVGLPSLKDNSVGGETEKEIKTKIEKVVSDWFQEALRKEE